ncbi:N-acetylglucosamine kinase-like BadF-type ATPase [Dysgonomonas alginatilytica]|uniref:N-acetylglucosamine kinase-like BadF-type ATPase n=1 Tax=Dysgonomonas alginatilytica TaxID=1605892 RepID=A0A2V3PUE6_9BACT|nr:ATPase [Dysgonomonas alginatilytica]PXV63005.1 N-acetylglucosamine kinase-like BadF-type ATPase [Dysgonomonas alginatilytica]
MILLADGGSTKVDWCLIDQGKKIKQVYTKGANPFFRSREEISEELKIALAPKLTGYPIDKVYFYGAGCAFPEKNEIIRLAIADSINTSSIHVGSDLLAAARGLCGNQKGIAAIIGTGSNSCFYDGQEIVNNVSPLGYVLGDEGSGAVLGRLLVGACLKNQLTEGLKEKFLSQFELTPAIILDKVYKQPMANRFLAGLSVFLIENIEDQTVYNLSYNAFKEFFLRNIMQYDYLNNKVHLTGSVAFYYQKVLREVANELTIEIGTITQSPMEGLIGYHSHLE